jgi:hypothetical protein
MENKGSNTEIFADWGLAVPSLRNVRPRLELLVFGNSKRVRNKYCVTFTQPMK